MAESEVMLPLATQERRPVNTLNPQPDLATELELERLAASHRANAAVYEWGGYRYSNASDAIAAAKRDRK
jgi:hypothetical protein